MQFQYCPKCGTKYSDTLEKSAYKCGSCSYVFYINSKPTASALIEDGDKLLLGKRKFEPGKGKWDIIGGFLNYGEDLEDGLKREALEETSLEVELIEFFGSYVGTYNFQGEASHTLDLVYRTKPVGGEAKANDDIEELQWFHKDELPTEMAFKGQLEVINKWRELKSK